MKDSGKLDFDKHFDMDFHKRMLAISLAVVVVVAAAVVMLKKFLPFGRIDSQL